MGYRVAVVGATGNVGREMLNILAERRFPASEVIALASSRSQGQEISYGDKRLKVQNLENFDFTGVDFALMQYVIVQRIFGIPIVFYYAVLLALIIWYVFEHTAIGRRVLFVGRGREVARLSGINTDRIRWGGLVASSLLGAVAGILYCGTQGAADPSSGTSFQLPAFAAAFLGSTAIIPGRFNAWGTLIAVYFLVVGITGLIFLGMSSYVQSMFYGGALLVAVVLSQLVRGRAEQQF